ncbi:hypothetical protein D3C75_532850 [compost metagenome]
MFFSVTPDAVTVRFLKAMRLEELELPNAPGLATTPSATPPVRVLNDSINATDSALVIGRSGLKLPSGYPFIAPAFTTAATFGWLQAAMRPASVKAASASADPSSNFISLLIMIAASWRVISALG